MIVHSVIGDPAAGGGDETLDPRRSLLSERYDGTFAERVAVPRRNLVPKPAALTFAEAACLPTAYLTAYRMLFDRSGLQPGATVLVQGAGGGVATALILLGRAAGFRVWATSRSEEKRERALELGADQVFPSGARLPERVDAVMETVGEATWAHSLRSLRPGRPDRDLRGDQRRGAPAELNRVFFLQLSVVGSTMGTRDELARLARFCEQTGVRPRSTGRCRWRGRRRVRGDDLRRPVRQGRLHRLAPPGIFVMLTLPTSSVGKVGHDRETGRRYCW